MRLDMMFVLQGDMQSYLEPDTIKPRLISIWDYNTVAVVVRITED